MTPQFRLPQDSVISEAKLTQYLLVPLPQNDKSNFLAQAGYTLENWEQLQADIRNQVLPQPAELLAVTRYGTKYAVYAKLAGPNGQELKVMTIWMTSNDATRFITLVPDKGAT